MQRHFILLCGLLVFTACTDNSKKADHEEPKSIVATEESTRELRQSLADVEREEQQQLAEEMANLTSMSFDRLSHDYGKVSELSNNKTIFTVTNTGKKPLIIEKVSASCGCTTPSKPEQPIAPGKSDEIVVEFHPKENQLGQQNKTVTVIANTNPKMEVLNISAVVEKKKN